MKKTDQRGLGSNRYLPHFNKGKAWNRNRRPMMT